MEIVNRITLNSLGQKDKAVVKKTIKEAGKSFRGSEYVKLTLSKTDVSEEMAADTDYFKKLFTNVKNVEVEVLKDAPSGTVIIDNGSEITDAGIQTQLKMIEELGRGKYRLSLIHIYCQSPLLENRTKINRFLLPALQNGKKCCIIYN